MAQAGRSFIITGTASVKHEGHASDSHTRCLSMMKIRLCLGSVPLSTASREVEPWLIVTLAITVIGALNVQGDRRDDGAPTAVHKNDDRPIDIVKSEAARPNSLSVLARKTFRRGCYW